MNIQQMMQQAKVMQEKMQIMQEKLAQIEVEGRSGGGLVIARMNCKGECRAITVDPSIVKADEKEILEDLVKAALNDAKAKADATMASETQKMMKELGLPSNVSLPF